MGYAQEVATFLGFSKSAISPSLGVKIFYEGRRGPGGNPGVEFMIPTATRLKFMPLWIKSARTDEADRPRMETRHDLRRSRIQSLARPGYG